MEAMVVTPLGSNQTSLKWRFNNNYTFSKTLILKNPSFKSPTKTPPSLCFSCLSSPKPSTINEPFHHHHEAPLNNPTKHRTLLLETYHETQKLKNLVKELEKNNSDPLQILRDDGDWDRNQFWAVIRFLKNTSRFHEIPQVFDMWKNIEKSRNNKSNNEKIICLLGEVGLVEEAVLELEQMKIYDVNPSRIVYNAIIHGFARRGDFDNAVKFLVEMVEMGLKPEVKTYNGLIQFYGKYRKYDEMSKCVKKMEKDDCVPNYVTYNILIMEFARGGLITRMEGAYQTLLSKQMVLQSATLMVMLEVYVDIGILEKMEKVYRRVVTSKLSLKDDLIRKMARFYIQNNMFSRVEGLGDYIDTISGGTDLVWCLWLISHACLLSRNGMDFILEKMDKTKCSWNVTVLNILALAHLRMEGFRDLEALLLQIQIRNVKPDIITFGVLFDAIPLGFDGSRVITVWRRMQLLEQAVEMNTDPLVLAAFGKGSFLKRCEEMYSSIRPELREKRVWIYQELFEMVAKNK